MKYFLNLFLATILGTLFCVLPARATEPIRIMPLGDSITAGYTNNPTWSVPFEFGYRGPLYTKLTDAGYDFTYVGASTEPWTWSSSPSESQVAGFDLRTVGQDNHRGYGGAGISRIADNIVNWMNADNPDVILLMAGINNISQYSTADPVSTKNGLASLVNTIVTNRPDADLIVAQITPYAHYTDAIVQYNDYIANTLVPYYASQGFNITTVNQYDNLLTDGEIDPTLFSNGINHENATSYERMAQTWFDGIEALNLSGTVPEPSTIALLLGALVSLAVIRRVKK